MTLVWVTGASGTGKSTVCEALRERGHVALEADEDVLRHRLATRTTNAFGRHPEELAAALQWSARMRALHERRGATIVDASKPVSEVVDGVLDAAREPGGGA